MRKGSNTELGEGGCPKRELQFQKVPGETALAASRLVAQGCWPGMGEDGLRSVLKIAPYPISGSLEMLNSSIGL